MDAFLPSPASSLARGDVVSCRFPLAETPDTPGDKDRPCLVLDVWRMLDGAVIAEVAYGTSAETRSNVGFDLLIADAHDQAEAGVHRKTRFVLARTAVLPANLDWLAASAEGSVVLGRIPDHLRGRLNALDAGRRRKKSARREVEVVRLPKRRLVARRGMEPTAPMTR